MHIVYFQGGQQLIGHSLSKKALIPSHVGS